MGRLQHYLPFTKYPYVGAPSACSLCGSREGHVVSIWDRRLKMLTSLLCAKCGLVRTDPMPSEQELDEYYGGQYRLDYQFAAGKPPKRHIFKSRREAERRRALLESALKPNDRVVDFGSGSGEFVAAMQEAGYGAMGIEPGVTYATWSRAQYGIKIENGSYAAAPIAPGSLKLVTAHHVIEHLRDPLDAFRTIHRWLAADGLFYISVPDIASPSKPTFERFHFAHIYGFAPETLEMMGRKAGFEPDPRFATGDATTMVFRKAADANADWFVYPNAAARIRAASPVTHMRRHVMSGVWAEPMVKKAKRYLRESKAMRSDKPA